MALAHTPSFVGSHLTGYDVMLKGILEALAEPGDRTGKINIIPGFDGHAGNLREIKRMLTVMGVDFTMLADYSDVVDSGNTGHYEMYPTGGTTLADAADAPNAIATISLQRAATTKTGAYIAKEWDQEFVTVGEPIGINATDAFLARYHASPVSAFRPSSTSSAHARWTSSSTATPTCTASGWRWSAIPTCCSA